MNRTARGFAIEEFIDRYGARCSLQKSSLAMEDCVWLGQDEIRPRIMASKMMRGGTGWVDFPLPEGVEISGRMHLTQDMVKALLPALQKFADTGELT